MSETKLTASAEQQRAENERQEKVSYRFNQRHLGFKNTAENANLIAGYLTRTYGHWSKAWTDDGLEEAFEATKDKLAFKTAEELQADAAASLKTEHSKPQWKFPWAPLTKEYVDAMSRETFREYYKHPKFGKAFREQLNSLGVVGSGW